MKPKPNHVQKLGGGLGAVFFFLFAEHSGRETNSARATGRWGLWRWKLRPGKNCGHPDSEQWLFGAPPRRVRPVRSWKPFPAHLLQNPLGGFADPGPQWEGTGGRAQAASSRAEAEETSWGWGVRVFNAWLGLGLSRFVQREAVPGVSLPKGRKRLSLELPSLCPCPTEAGRSPFSEPWGWTPGKRLKA